MSPVIITLLVLLGVALLLALWLMGIYNRLVVAGNRFKNAFARQAFNDAATDYNIRREVFPANKVAGMFGFKEAALLETAETERAAPKVSF